jgi:redox-sensitive bicupin YhaK (pirin superfamily)
MIAIRHASERGPTRLPWLDSRHTFSFGHYYDPRHMGFGPLRVINEDTVSPGGGFAPHGHANMEIISYVLAGGLQHRDSLGTGSVIRPGDVQRMSAGSGIQHSEFNASQSEPVHFLQVWIQPDRLNVKPGYAQQTFSAGERQGRLREVISPDGRDGSIPIQQDASMFSALLAPGEKVSHALDGKRRAWLQVARGAVKLNGQSLSAGDGAAIEREPALEIAGVEDAEVLLFDLPQDRVLRPDPALIAHPMGSYKSSVGPGRNRSA